MGSFAGHVLPGAYFIVFGTWLSWSWIYSHYAKMAANKRPRKYCKAEFLLGSLLVFLPLTGIFLEQFVDNGPGFSVMNATTGNFQDINNWSHCSMYAYFMIYGCLTIINTVKPTQLNTELRNLLMCISLFIEGFLFYYHLHAKDMLEIRIHILLVYAIWSGALFSFLLVFVDKTPPPPLKKDKKGGILGEEESSLEYMPLTTCQSNEQLIEDNNSTNTKSSTFSNQQAVMDLLYKLRSEIHTSTTAATGGGQSRHSLTFLLRMALGTSLILQGTWFCQIATILYPVHGKPWDPEEHANTMFVAVSFSWHLISIIISQFIFSSLFSKLLARK